MTPNHIYQQLVHKALPSHGKGYVGKVYIENRVTGVTTDATAPAGPKKTRSENRGIPGDELQNPSASKTTPHYFTTALDLLPAESHLSPPGDLPPHVRFDARDYFRLTPGFHAWIVQCLAKARKSAGAGHIPASTLATLERRFEAVQQAAQTLYTPGELAQAKPQRPHVEPALDNPPGHCPHAIAPAPYRFPPDAPGFTESVAPSAVKQVRAILPQALALGWTEHNLLSNTGTFRLCGPGYGLVIYLHDGDSIGEVTHQSIEIKKARGHSLRFYNPDARQPWHGTTPAGAIRTEPKSNVDKPP